MSTLLKINVTNAQPNNNTFFFFQQPAVYTGGQKVYSNSLYCRTLGPASQGGSITFMVNYQFYAAVQETGTATPAVGSSSGYESAMQAIDIAAAGNSPANLDCATMTWDTTNKILGLLTPVNNSALQAGAFRIMTAVYSPPTFFNAGSGIYVQGSPVLSNFVNAQPQTNIDCQPILKFYVQTGNYTAGTVIDFNVSSAKAAVCDFTSGYTVANVVYKTDGSWDVTLPVLTYQRLRRR